jgi:hypothetical protein
MIRHIVSWRLKAEDAAGKAEAAAEITRELLALPALIPEIVSLTVGTNINEHANYDVVLVADYASLDDLGVYVEHPDHKLAAGVIRELVSERAAVDFEF